MFDPSCDPPPATCTMFTLFLRLVVPAICTSVLGMVTFVTNSVFAGRMDDPVKLAVVGLAGTCCNIMVNSLMIGLTCA